MRSHPIDDVVEKLRTLPPERIAEVADFVDFLKQRTQTKQSTPYQREPLNFPVDDIGPWPESLSLRREDIYGDDGR